MIATCQVPFQNVRAKADACRPTSSFLNLYLLIDRGQCFAFQMLNALVEIGCLIIAYMPCDMNLFFMCEHCLV